MDLGIEVILALFSRKGLQDIFDFAAHQQSIESQNAKRIFALQGKYIHTIDSVISFLQGHNPTLARNYTSFRKNKLCQQRCAIYRQYRYKSQRV
ncbi:MAG: hypothetical protein O3C19_07965 [Bacteroidetes bacterium]|nr:hypothetical protein [Bacteroidota bacterium]